MQPFSCAAMIRDKKWTTIYIKIVINNLRWRGTHALENSNTRWNSVHSRCKKNIALWRKTHKCTWESARALSASFAFLKLSSPLINLKDIETVPASTSSSEKIHKETRSEIHCCFFCFFFLLFHVVPAERWRIKRASNSVETLGRIFKNSCFGRWKILEK